MKNCTRCKYADWKKTSNGRLHPSGEGRCTYPIKMPVLPNAFWWISRAEPQPSGGYIERKRDYNNHCPYFQDKP